MKKIRFRDMTGMKFGKWKVIQYAGQSRWWCKCIKCGEQQKVIAWNVWSGHSAGCKKCQIRSLTKHSHAIVGRVTPTYYSWYGMWRRCVDPHHVSYKNYGGRNIKVCDRWKSFENFLHDMGEKPKGLEIDRKDNNGDYTPTNCRWVTHKINSCNKSNTRIVLYDGVRMPLTHVEKMTGRCLGSLFQILKRFGWPQIDLKILPKPIPRNFLKQFSK